MSGSKRSALSSFDVVEMHRRALHLPPCAAGQDAALACFARPLRQASGICRARQVGPQQQQQQPPLHQLHQEAICSWWPAGVPQPQRRLVVAHGRRKSVPTPVREHHQQPLMMHRPAAIGAGGATLIIRRRQTHTAGTRGAVLLTGCAGA